MLANKTIAAIFWEQALKPTIEAFFFSCASQHDYNGVFSVGPQSLFSAQRYAFTRNVSTKVEVYETLCHIRLKMNGVLVFISLHLSVVSYGPYHHF